MKYRPLSSKFIFDIDGERYVKLNYYDEVITDIESRVVDAMSSMDKGVPWIGDAYDAIKALAKDLY